LNWISGAWYNTKRLPILWKQMKDKLVFQAYCDASGIFDHPFQSIGVVSGNIETVEELRSVLGSIITENGIREVKFADIKRYDSQEYRAAHGFMARTISGYCRYGKIRIDVLIWDTSDSRHAIPSRDDIENLGRLYYHLLCNLTTRWPKGNWNVIIDKDEKVDFTALKDCINYNISRVPSGTMPEIIYSISQLEELDLVKDIREVESHEEPLVQIADLFAGLGRFSYEKGPECCKWLTTYGNPNQYQLPNFLVATDTINKYLNSKYSKSDECRYQLIGELNRICKKHSLSVSLDTEKRLRTKNPAKAVNFWPYEPQGDYDKAPIK